MRLPPTPDRPATSSLQHPISHPLNSSLMHPRVQLYLGRATRKRSPGDGQHPTIRNGASRLQEPGRGRLGREEAPAPSSVHPAPALGVAMRALTAGSRHPQQAPRSVAYGTLCVPMDRNAPRTYRSSAISRMFSPNWRPSSARRIYRSASPVALPCLITPSLRTALEPARTSDAPHHDPTRATCSRVPIRIFPCTGPVRSR